MSLRKVTKERPVLKFCNKSCSSKIPLALYVCTCMSVFVLYVALYEQWPYIKEVPISSTLYSDWNVTKEQLTAWQELQFLLNEAPKTSPIKFYVTSKYVRHHRTYLTAEGLSIFFRIRTSTAKQCQNTPLKCSKTNAKISPKRNCFMK